MLLKNLTYTSTDWKTMVNTLYVLLAFHPKLLYPLKSEETSGSQQNLPVRVKRKVILLLEGFV